MSTQLDLSRTFFAVYSDASYKGEHLLFVLTSALIMLPSVFGDGRPSAIRTVLGWRWLGWLGLISYGVFLYHGPFVLWLSNVEADDWVPGSGYFSLTFVACVMSIVAAALSYYVIERPALRFKERRSRRWSRSPAVARSAPDESAPGHHAPALPAPRSATSGAAGSA